MRKIHSKQHLIGKSIAADDIGKTFTYTAVGSSQHSYWSRTRYWYSERQYQAPGTFTAACSGPAQALLASHRRMLFGVVSFCLPSTCAVWASFVFGDTTLHFDLADWIPRVSVTNRHPVCCLPGTRYQIPGTSYDMIRRAAQPTRASLRSRDVCHKSYSTRRRVSYILYHGRGHHGSYNHGA